jgi:hypothetical protein
MRRRTRRNIEQVLEEGEGTSGSEGRRGEEEEKYLEGGGRKNIAKEGEEGKEQIKRTRLRRNQGGVEEEKREGKEI